MDWRLILQVVVVIVALGLAGTLAYFFVKSKPDAVAEDSASMPIVARRILVWYLILIGVTLLYGIEQVGSAEFPEGGLQAEIINQTDKPSDPGAPVLDSIYTQTNPSNPTAIDLVLYGKNFTNDSKVCLRDVEETPAVIGTQRLRLDQQNVAGQDSIEIFVVNPKQSASGSTAPNTPSPCLSPGANTASNTLFVRIRKAPAKIKLFSLQIPIDRELQLLLLALFAGALGSYVHAIKSLADFIGNRTLTASWFWWYITRPFLGAAMALIFYAVLRGGFLAGTPADAKVVNPFGVLAIGALVGMFADQATQKLAEIFDTLFTAKDQRGGKLAAPSIDKLEPDHADVGTSAPVEVKISGERMGKVNKVTVNKQDRTPENVSDKQVTVKLQPDDMKEVRDIFITVADPDGVSPAATFHVTGLKIVPPQGTADGKLPNATVGQPYQASFSANGGTPPYQWALVTPPAGFAIDAQGSLTGTPTAAGELKITVKLTDSKGVSVSGDFKLT